MEKETVIVAHQLGFAVLRWADSGETVMVRPSAVRAIEPHDTTFYRNTLVITGDNSQYNVGMTPEEVLAEFADVESAQNAAKTAPAPQTTRRTAKQ